MSWQDTDAIFGDLPEVGDLVYVDFGDAVTATPETRDQLTYIGPKGIALEHGQRRYEWVEIAHIEVIERHK